MQKQDSGLETFKVRCRAAGLRATPQRLEILRELMATEEHPDAETLFRRVRRRLPTISLDTVYRTLWSLEEKGLIACVGAPVERYRFDGNLRKHHHFVCTRCGAVRDFYSDRFDGLSAPAAVKELGEPESIQVEVRGVCAACRKPAARK